MFLLEEWKFENIFTNCQALSAILILCCYDREIWWRFKPVLFCDTVLSSVFFLVKWKTWLIIFNLFEGLFHTLNKEDRKPVKSSENNTRNSNQTLTKWIARSRFIQHPSNKAMFFWWAVCIANAALMVG